MPVSPTDNSRADTFDDHPEHAPRADEGAHYASQS
jgi:hypothetical protein